MGSVGFFIGFGLKLYGLLEPWTRGRGIQRIVRFNGGFVSCCISASLVRFGDAGGGGSARSDGFGFGVSGLV